MKMKEVRSYRTFTLADFAPRVQKVHLSRTQSGIPGFFTGNTLAMRLSEDTFEQCVTHTNIADEQAKRFGFEMESAEDNAYSTLTGE